MPRKSGPIGRVRNIRNQDPGGIPGPYPQLMTLELVSWTNGVPGLTDAVAVVSPRDAISMTEYNFPALKITGPEGFTLEGAPAVGIAESDNGALSSIVINFGDISFSPGSGIIAMPWLVNIRGLNDQWLAPGVTNIT